MKINVFTCSVSRSAGGLLDAVRDLYLKMKVEDAHPVIYSYLDENTEADLPSWNSMEIKLFKKANPFFYSLEIKRNLLSSDGDILHVHGLWRYPHAFINTWKSKKISKPVIVTPHGMLDPYIIANQSLPKRVLGDMLFAKKAFKNVNVYHALCLAELEVLRTYGITQPIAVIPNGIDMPDTTKRYARTDHKKHLLFLGRLHPKKGVDMLIEALGKSNNQHKELLNGWIVDIVGWPQEGFDKKLIQMVEEYGLQDKVKFHGGLFGEAKERMYATSDAYILPSHGEGLPMTVLEAWAWGLPVIMTPQCNIPEGYAHNAAIKIENNSESIYQNLNSFLLMSEDDQKAMGDNGKRLVKNNFTWELSAKKMVKLYHWIVEGGTAPDFIYLQNGGNKD